MEEQTSEELLTELVVTGREYRKRLKKAFDQNNIEIPFPHRTVYWGEQINSLKVESNNRIQGELKRTD